MNGFVAALLAFTFAAAENSVLHFVVIEPEKGRAIEHLCSRGLPGPIQSYWLPRSADVAAAELLLPRYVATLGRSIPPFAEYYRQYVGIVISERRLLYINLFHQSHLEILEELPTKIADRERGAWLHEVVDVCDGGENYWGVVFDPATGKFSSPQFNGYARAPSVTPPRASAPPGRSSSS